jgi:FMN-dependent NADH-azoreductase
VSAWLQHVLGFIGIDDVTIINSSGLMKAQDEVIERAERAIEAIV